jgi:EAL domain-containing protein (putative c-di-GMP-specific phosphodiesterase class I)
MSDAHFSHYSEPVLLTSLLGGAELSFDTQPIFSARFPEAVLYDPSSILYEECLARFKGGRAGFLGTERFIRVLEREGGAPLFDCRMLSLILQRLADDPTAILGCNLSANSLANTASWEAFIGLIRARPDLSRRLVLELTETGPLVDSGRASEMLAEARALGCRIALDDFGAGFSSPRLVQQIAPDIVKIDKAFVRDVRPSTRGSNSLGHLVGFASSYTSIVVVEGIETMAQAETARLAGATHLQGYFLSQPVPAGVRS